MSDSTRRVPEVHPAIVAHALADAARARDSTRGQARLICERGLRDRADAVLQVLAAGALGGGTWRDVLRLVDSGDPPTGGAESHPWWASMGRVVLMHAVTADEIALAARLFDVAMRVDPARPFSRPEYLAYVQALADTGQAHRIPKIPRLASAVVEGEDSFIALNDLASRGDRSGWLRHLNATFMAPHGLAPVAIADGAATPFDGLSAPSAASAAGDALITVIMSTYRRGPELLTALRSVLAQTWGELEVIVVDDCSGPEHDAVLAQAAALDARVTVLRQPRNLGTYAARNRALESARGDLITFQDDDDWSHPERLARQAAPLLDDPLIHSTLSDALQASDELTFRHAGRRTLLMNSSSLMFRRSDLGKLGGFDGVRKGADTEFIRRMRAALPGYQERVEQVLAFVRLTGGSLSRSDFRPGWNHPTRSEYAESADRWRRRIAAGESAIMPTGPDATRPFPAPRRFVDPDAPDPVELDVIVAADAATPLVRASAAWERIEQSSARNESVGILALDDPLRIETPGRTRITDDVRDLIATRAVERVFTDGPATCHRLVIADPALLALADREPWALRPDHVEVWCEDPPVEASAGSRWSAADCADALAAVLPGAHLTWAVRSQEIADAIETAAPGSRVVVAVEPGPQQSPSIARHRRDDAAVIGRVGSHRTGAWPASPALVAEAYPDDAAIDVRILGAAPDDHSATSWLVYALDDLTLDAFLCQLDAYVHSGEDEPVAIERRVMARAASWGVPVVLAAPGAMDLDHVAVRCAPHEVSDAVATVLRRTMRR